MIGKPWFRFYAEFASDPKVQLLAFEDQRHFVVVLCMKCAGTLDASAAVEYRERMIAKALGLDTVAAIEAKRRLFDVGLIANDWQPVAWDRRQYASDSSAARTHEWRQRERSKRHSDVTVTDKSRAEQSSKSARATRSARASPDREALEAAALAKLQDRRAAVGIPDFRDPTPAESADLYREAQEFEIRLREGKPKPRFGREASA
jgi:hypothetical protein